MEANLFKPEIVWIEPLREVGDVGDGETPNWSKLLGQVEIAGVPHHIEGWAVRYDGEEEDQTQEVISPYTSYEAITGEMTEGAGVTVEINGHDYFIVVTPHQL